MIPLQFWVEITRASRGFSEEAYRDVMRWYWTRIFFPAVGIFVILILLVAYAQS